MNKKNYVFIDGNNLYLGAKSQRINLDYKKLRLYLMNKFNVDKAFLFIGYDPNNTNLYAHLQKIGFILIHKPTVVYVENGKRQMKGNVDAELVLYSAAIEYRNYDKAIIITSDGDFACLMRFLISKNKLDKIITPTKNYSKLLKPFGQHILPLSVIRDKITK
ncbi:NYN domain-containing protein [Candidatus Saccharibacteria bacterium]|nr:NYN domain-containing protein [Candidatus Saccharibacteria bacterium]